VKALEVVIEKGTDGYGAYLRNVDGLTGFGETIEEAKESLKDGISEYLEYCKDEGINYEEELEDWQNATFVYKFDLQELFNHFSFINVSELAGKIGMNASLLRKYRSGLAFAGEKQREKIKNALHEFGEELLNLEL
jgi:predicted RNase H-like HicB family nuclease